MQSKLQQSCVRHIELTCQEANKRFRVFGFFVLTDFFFFSKHDMDPAIFHHRCAADNTKRSFHQVNK